MSELWAPREGHERDVNLVFEGGGLKGTALVGAYSVLEERGYVPQNVAGASAGAIVAALVASGYTARELREVLGSLDFSTLRDKTWQDWLPIVPSVVSVLKDRGLYEGEAFLRWISGLLEAKGVVTFGDLVRHPSARRDEPAEARYRYGLQVIATDLTEERLLVLPRD